MWRIRTVHEGAASLGQASDGDSEVDTLAIGTGGGLDGTTESRTSLLRKRADVLGADGVAGHFRSGSDGRGLSSDGGGRSQDGDDREAHLDSM
jgi:hypothetical protein